MNYQFLTTIATDLESQISNYSFSLVAGSGLFLIVVVIISILFKDKLSQTIKKLIFGSIILAVSTTTLFLIGSTIYLNNVSYTKGPVHWHADFEVWVCSNQLEIRQPLGRLSNKIGTPTLHEHDDGRVHLEGVPITEYDASLQKFFKVIEGDLGEKQLIVPLNSSEKGSIYDDEYAFSKASQEIPSSMLKDVADGRILSVTNGADCGDSAEVQSNNMVQVYRYRIGPNDTYTQQKMDLSKSIVIRDEEQVPPGDCYIVEYGPESNFTKKLCAQYGIRDKNRCHEFGVKPGKDDLCTMTDITIYDQGGS